MSWWSAFRTRIDSVERIDLPDTSVDELRANLREQALMNRWFGGLAAVRTHALPFLQQCDSYPIRLLEIGCGGADLSRRLIDDGRRLGKPIEAIGLDRHAGVLHCAKEWCNQYPEMTLLHADALSFPFRLAEFDIVLLPDVLHHLTEHEMVQLLRIAGRISRGIVIATDLLRSPLAYIGFCALARLAHFSPMSRYDGALSIRRALLPKELLLVALQAQIQGSHLRHHPWFRLSLMFPGSS